MKGGLSGVIIRLLSVHSINPFFAMNLGGLYPIAYSGHLRPAFDFPEHQRVDQAVFAAYGWNPDLGDEEILEKLLALNLERANK